MVYLDTVLSRIVIHTRIETTITINHLKLDRNFERFLNSPSRHYKKRGIR